MASVLPHLPFCRRPPVPSGTLLRCCPRSHLLRAVAGAVHGRHLGGERPRGGGGLRGQRRHGGHAAAVEATDGSGGGVASVAWLEGEQELKSILYLWSRVCSLICWQSKWFFRKQTFMVNIGVSNRNVVIVYFLTLLLYCQGELICEN